MTVTPTRREFLDAGATALAGTCLAAPRTTAAARVGAAARIKCLDRIMYQIDTGPIAYPDLSKPFDPPLDCLRLAFVAFNAPHFADFVVEQSTALVEDGQEKGKLYHFSGPFSLPAKNTLLALGCPRLR